MVIIMKREKTNKRKFKRKESQKKRKQEKTKKVKDLEKKIEIKCYGKNIIFRKISNV